MPIFNPKLNTGLEVSGHTVRDKTVLCAKSYKYSQTE